MAATPSSMPTLEGLKSFGVRPLAFDGKDLFINGEFVKSNIQGDTFDCFDPTNGEVGFVLPNANDEDVNRAVQAAYNARISWAAIPAEERAGYLEKLASLIEQNQKRLSVIESADVGKLFIDSEGDVAGAVEAVRLNAKFCRELEGKQNEYINTSCVNQKSRICYEPYGVLGLIIPWNYPFYLAAIKVSSALAAGNTCILKPSEYASLSSIELADLIRQAKFPSGVFNLVTGIGMKTGMPLVKHSLVRKVTFTGSVATGKVIMRTAADSVKAIQLELGGKSPMLVFEDVNIKAATNWILSGICTASGQICCATSRVLIHESIYGEVIKNLKEAAEKITIGKYTDKPAPQMGPLISPQQYQRVLGYLDLAEFEKLSVVTGGTTDRPAHLKSGYFVQPTIFKDVPVTSKLWKEEIFGPVLCLRSFATEEEALKVANDSDFGLAAAVMTKDDKRRERVGRLLEAGTVWENCSLCNNPAVPFGGFKTSGIGKEQGHRGFMEYLQVKVITSADPDFYTKSFIN